MPLLQRGAFATYFEETGQGEPVVLICGFGAELQAWRFNLTELGKHFRVITFDNRGAGRSGAPDEPYSLEQMADDLAALMDHLGVAAAGLLGWSMGGMIAQLFAVKYPARVRSLALLHTALAPDAFTNAPFGVIEAMRGAGVAEEHVVRLLARLVYSPPTVNNPVVL